MGAVAYGSRVGADEHVLRYTFGVDPQQPEGEVVIPVEDVDGWYVDGSQDRPTAAQRVVMKAFREHRRSGRWPERVTFQS